MKTTKLGTTGLEVSRLCLGCMTYGDPGWRPWILPEKEARAHFARAIELGFNFFDTADMYSNGASEQVTGKILGELSHREDYVLATKCFFPHADSPNRKGLSRKHILAACDASLKRLGHDYIDLFQIHRLDHTTPMEEILDALDLNTVSIVANSMGGYWSVFYAIDAPARVSRLVLVGAPAGTKREIALQLRMTRWPLVGALIRSLMSKPTRESTRDFWKQICVAHPERLDDELLDAVACSQRRNISSWFSLMECMMDAGGIRRELVIGERWKALQVPVVFLWGEKDAFDSPAHGERIATYIPAGGRLVRIPDAGHLPWLDDPARVISEIERALEA